VTGRRNGKFEDPRQNDTLINEMANIRKPTTSQSWSTKIEEKWSQWNEDIKKVENEKP